MRQASATLVLIFIFLIQPLKADEQFFPNGIVHPLIFDCLGFNYVCESKAKTIYFSNRSTQLLENKVIVKAEPFTPLRKKSFNYYFENNMAFKGSTFSDKYGFKSDKKIPEGSSVFDKADGYVGYEVVRKLEDFIYNPKQLKTSSDVSSNTSHWLIYVYGSLNPRQSGKEGFFAFIELNQNLQGEQNSIVLLKKIETDWMDWKYGFDVKYMDKNEDGFKDVIFSYSSGGTCMTNKAELMYFFRPSEIDRLAYVKSARECGKIEHIAGYDDSLREKVKEDEETIFDVFIEEISTIQIEPKSFPVNFQINTLFEMSIVGSKTVGQHELLKQIAESYASNKNAVVKCEESSCDIYKTSVHNDELTLGN